MAQALISKKGGGGDDYATITFNNVTVNNGALHLPATDLSVGRYNLSATTVGDYALFGGGDGSSYYSTVDAYNTSLTRSTPTSLSVGRRSLSSTTVGDYALFGGGDSGSQAYYSTVDAYNKSLTRSTPTSLSSARGTLAATTVGNYALFGGGYSYSYSSSSSQYYSTVDAYNTSLTRSTPTALSVGRYNLAATTVEDYALFGGGDSDSTSSYYSTVDAYNTSLTRSTPTSLSFARSGLAATAVGSYALFGGGYNYSGSSYSGYYSTVDAYNTSLTHSTPTALSIGRYNLSATTVGDYALFGGGGTGNASSLVVDAYNNNLIRSTPMGISPRRQGMGATTVGSYALFGGGRSDNYSGLSVVDAYFLGKKIQLYPDTKYKFNGMADEATSQTFQGIDVVIPINGYIKIKDASIS